MQQQREVAFSKSVAATVLQSASRRLTKWANRLDGCISNLYTKNSRELRKELSLAIRLGPGIDNLNLKGVLMAFPPPRNRDIGTESDIEWGKVSRFERWRAKNALWRAAREAHPEIALRALVELDHFIPNELRAQMAPADKQISPSEIAAFGLDALPYLVNWLQDDGYENAGHPALSAIAQITDERTFPYLTQLKRLSDTDTRYTFLVMAVNSALVEVERNLLEAIRARQISMNQADSTII